MKIILTIAAILLALQVSVAAAATDRGYYVAEATAQQKFDVFNDGRNTYIEAIQGLVITGATVDSVFYIVNGVPQKIGGYLNGKPISIVRGVPPQLPATDKSNIAARIAKLTADLSVLAKGSAKQSSGATAAGESANPSETVSLWRIAPSDNTLRELTAKWASTVGWKAVWEVDRDIPIDSADEMSGNFKSAVRYALGSTEFTDIKVKPCFYTNRVVRITLQTTECKPAK